MFSTITKIIQYFATHPEFRAAVVALVTALEAELEQKGQQ
jgi:mannose/fructose/N-acetylgalactosamine-specific phosphotransferase system component IID